MRAVPDEKKFVIADQNSYTADLISPNPRGWYHSVANVVATPAGLVAVYRLSDSHSAVCTHIMVAYSSDGGRAGTVTVPFRSATSGSTRAFGWRRS